MTSDIPPFSALHSPADLFGPLFAAVQAARLYPDGKTFADAVPRGDPAAILAAYAREAPGGAEALRAFVSRHFILPEMEGGGDAIVPGATLRGHIAALWPHLTRAAVASSPGSSALAFPATHVVPGGRFRELYYWDSYFTMLGLKADGQDALVRSMISGFASLLARHGRIPNGTRTYYLGRSQPPFLSFMLDLAGEEEAGHLAALRTEHAFWISGPRVVRMPDGSLLNRYWDDRVGPRDESRAEDVATAALGDRPLADVYRDLRAGAESGWDYSARWLTDPLRLETIRTTRIVPVDLNSLLWALEDALARRCAAAGDMAGANHFAALAQARRAAIDRYLWLPAERRFADRDMADGPTAVMSAATLFPLFAGHADTAQAGAVAETVRGALLAPGGLRTTLVESGQQWDAPNGWAPLQWIAVAGLARYSHTALAREIASRWIATVNRTFRDTGRLVEKYDVETIRPGGGGEYALQDGFGWTNGVTAALIARYPDLDPDG